MINDIDKIKIKNKIISNRSKKKKKNIQSHVDFSALPEKQGKGVSDKDKDRIEILTRTALKNKEPFPDELMPLFSPLILDIVTKVLKKNSNLASKKNDLIQEAFVGLMIGLNRFNPTAKNKVTTYVYAWIRRTIITYAYQEKYLVKIDSYYPDLIIFIADCFKQQMTQDQIYKSIKRDGTKWLVPSYPDGGIRRVITSTLEKHIALIVFEISFEIEDYQEIDENRIMDQGFEVLGSKSSNNLIDKFRSLVLDNPRITPREKSIYCDWFGEDGESFEYYSRHRLKGTNEFSSNLLTSDIKDKKKRDLISSMYLMKNQSVRDLLCDIKSFSNFL